MQYFCLKLVQYNEYLVSMVDTDDLVLQHQGISSLSAENAPIHPVFIWFNSTKNHHVYKGIWFIIKSDIYHRYSITIPWKSLLHTFL